jgi:large subunit ribosomal protein L19
MNTSLISKISNKTLNKNLPEFRVGDTVEVATIIRDGDKQRTQIFAGLVISRRGTDMDASFTVRKISYGVGVEKSFPLHSPNLTSVTVTKLGKPRRAKLFYLRDRVGKLALKVKVGSKAKRTQLEVPASVAQTPVVEAEQESATEAN